jgi:hypothetical protein
MAVRPNESDDSPSRGEQRVAESDEQAFGSGREQRVQKGRFVETDESSDDGSDGPPVNGVYRDSAVSDRVAESDALGFRTYVSVLARFLRHERTKGPLTVSIEGPWGSG